jgi:hypothetical protein
MEINDVFNSANTIFLGGFQSLVTFFKVVIAFIPHTLEYLMIIFSVLIVLIPALLSIIFYVITHLFVLLKIAECFILMRFIITAGFFEKLNSYFNNHVLLIKGIIALPKFLMDLSNSFMIMIYTCIEILKYIRDLITYFLSWIVAAASNPEPIQSAIVTSIIIIAFLAFITALFSL